MSELLLISSLDPVEAGENLTESRHPWVTLQQYFTIPDEKMDTFVSRVGEAVEAFSPITVTGTEESDTFGPNEDVRVRRVSAVGLQALHTVLGEVIYHHDGDIRNPEWAFEGYNPHITYVDGRALKEGEQALLQTVELVGKNDAGDKIIQSVWRLESTAEA
ncbi:hypothetical protein KI440_03830 [Candidatus Saccharibacteria bacterium TM7i]|nr:hypothetical protein KI440_03830 [Candidatus Saccharibacteria bacterium TM7i]